VKNIENHQAFSTVKKIFGGPLIGISYECEKEEDEQLGFNFLNWNGKKSEGGFLPQPKILTWDYKRYKLFYK
jgi:hypothetical protein